MSTPQVLQTVEEFRTALAEAVGRCTSGAAPAASDAVPSDAVASAAPAAEHPVVGFVPTMGALHSGHAALLEAARKSADLVVASVFVNPLQFDDDADFRHYPRQLEDDVALLTEHGADLVFAPELGEMYPGFPDSPQVSVTAGEMGRLWEGAFRPGHFDGVVTVVAKLFSIVSPPAPARLHAWFGAKDAEQVAIISRMTRDLNLPVTVRTVPTVRDENGLALSSRNQRLSATDYEASLELSRALFTLRDRASAGEPLGVGELREGLARTPGVEPDYLVVVDPLTLRELPLGGGSETPAPGVAGGEAPGRSTPDPEAGGLEVPGLEVSGLGVPSLEVPGLDAPGPGTPALDTPGPDTLGLDAEGVLRGEALALVAARVGPVRLIDNMRLNPAP